MSSPVITDPGWWAAVGAAVSAPFLTPLLLSRRTWQLSRPKLALALWLLAFLTGSFLAGFSLIRLIVDAVRLQSSAATGVSVALTIAAWVGLGALGAVTSFVWVAAEPLSFTHKTKLSTLVPIATKRRRLGKYTIVHFDSTELLAFTGGPRSREVYLSSALRTCLSQAELHAVVEHELVHLRQRHGLIVRLAEINAACLPSRLPASRDFKRAALLLVELIADDAAARRVGPARYANTLVTMARATGDPSFEIRARRVASQRFHRNPITKAWRLLTAH